MVSIRYFLVKNKMAYNVLRLYIWCYRKILKDTLCDSTICNK